jgi:hypothetical protein
MPTPTLSRLSGLALVLAAALLAIGTPLAAGLQAQLPDVSLFWVPVHLALVAGYLLLVLGLPGLYAALARTSGAFGLAAFVWAETAAALMPGLAAIDLYAVPLIGTAPSAGWLLTPGGALGDFGTFRTLGLQPALLVGLALLSIAGWRAQAPTRWAWLPIVLGLAAALTTGYGIFNLVAYAGLAWIGAGLARSTSTPPR